MAIELLLSVNQMSPNGDSKPEKEGEPEKNSMYVENFRSAFVSLIALEETYHNTTQSVGQTHGRTIISLRTLSTHAMSKCEQDKRYFGWQRE